MKKQLGLLSILIVCLIVGLYFFFSSSDDKKSNAAARNFKIENIAEVDKIFLATSDGITVTLKKEEQIWRVNDQYVARPIRIETLLKTAKNIEVKQKVPKKKQERIFKNLATKNIKAEFYAKGNLIKSYYIGSADGSTTGTYALLIDEETGENFNEPFLTHLLGFEGYLTPRYEPDPSTWRDLKVFYYPKNAIESVELKYPNNPENNFKIKLKEGKYLLEENGQSVNCNETAIKKYLLNFKSIAAERLIPPSRKDSIENSLPKIPWFELTVTNLLGKSTTVQGHKISMPAGSTNAIGLPLLYDPDRFYGRVFNGEIGILQYFVFDPLLVNKTDLQ